MATKRHKKSDGRRGPQDVYRRSEHAPGRTIAFLRLFVANASFNFLRLRRSSAHSSVTQFILLALVFIVIGQPVRATDWHALMPEEFARRPEVRARVDFAAFDRVLMAAAIFHESNRVRARLGLPAFVRLPKLDAAADLKASVGVVQNELTHTNPLPLTAQPADRVKAVGLRYRQVAENIARLGLFDLPAGTSQVMIRERAGRTEFLNPLTREPAELLSYAGFAELALRSWMNSPGHRAHLVNPELTHLGTAARPCRSPVVHHEQVYAVQVFLEPR